MSMKSLGFVEPSARGGQYTLPTLFVRGGTIENIEDGPFLAQFEIQHGLVLANQTLNQIQAQYFRQLQTYTTILNEYNVVVATNSINFFDQVKSNVNDLYQDVANNSVGTVVYNFNLVGNFLRNYAKGISPDVPYILGVPQNLTKGIYFVSVKIALSCYSIQNGQVTLTSGQTITNNQPSKLNACYTQVVFKIDGVIYTSRIQSQKTFRGTNIFMNCSAYIELESSGTLSIEWSFVNNNPNEIDTDTTGFTWTAGQLNTSQNIDKQAIYIQPNTATVNNPSTTKPVANACNINSGVSPTLTIYKLT